MPTASEITVKETLDLLDGGFQPVAEAICNGGYAFWLGSGVSRDRVIGLDGVLAKLLEFLRVRAVADPAGPYATGLEAILALAALPEAARRAIDLNRPVSEWIGLDALINALWRQYSAVLATEIDGEPADHLLWEGVDFTVTFAAQEPDLEHYAVAVLALEGVVTEVATPNWDGLIEGALAKLGWAKEAFRVTVTGEDLREPSRAQATLYKFHGCALRAINDEAAYRKLLVARQGQIVRWSATDDFRIVREQLQALIQRQRTLMVGLSAQDANIQKLFAEVGAHEGWKWNDSPTPIVVATETLGLDQKAILEAAYGDDYDANRVEIAQAARLRAYSKPLFAALVLKVIGEKLKVLASDIAAPNLDEAARAALGEGITHLRDLAANAGDADRRGLMAATIGAVSRTRSQLSDGRSLAGALKYYPMDDQPVNRMKGKQALAATGQREAAAALGLIGLDARDTGLGISVGDVEDPRTAAVTLAAGASGIRVFLAANDDSIGDLLGDGAYDETDPDVIVICSRRVADEQQRSPSGQYRDGRSGPRYISLGPMLGEAEDLADLRDAFGKAIGL
ncbi:SIR2 family protein [Brevundimonas sp. G8]|uniref:SIR2 family protein n=1 Tax=Brevundimonas sp. G8 TaxID=1350776 RepID=UPI001357B3ED|nr:SIR2 family protein [Brevundimonas sp. G8]